MFTNEDYADYVLGISIPLTHGQIRVPKKQAEEIINRGYSVYCDIKGFQKIFVPIRVLDKYELPVEPIKPPEHLLNIPYMGKKK